VFLFFSSLLLLRYTHDECLLCLSCSLLMMMMMMIEKKLRKIFYLNTENIYLAFVRLEWEEKRQNDTVSFSLVLLVVFLFFLLHTRARCDNIFFGCWLVLCTLAERILSHVNLHTYIHERDDGIGRYDNIFSFSLLLSLPIVNRSLSLSLSRSRFSLLCALLKWRQRTEMSSKQSALPHRK